MYLSRIALPDTREAMLLLADWHSLHTAVLTGCPRGADRALFRLEPAKGRQDFARAILVQSEHPPEWAAERWPDGTRFDPPRPIPTQIPKGACFRFRLRANPAVKKKVEGKGNGRREGILGEEQQLSWLKRKGEMSEGKDGKPCGGGFRVTACRVIDEKQLEARKSGGQRLSFRSVLFEGILEVTDPDAFKKTLCAGIGPGKAFGFGLLSIAPA